MTPTEQDEKLRDAIIKIVEAEYKSPNYYIPAVERIDHIMQLITADRERVALEARIDELEGIDRRVSEDESKGKFASRSKYIRERIAELKQELENL